MFNTMTITKAAGALIGALLFMMLANWAASSLYHVTSPVDAEGQQVQAYGIEVEEAAPAAAEDEEPALDVEELLASADLGAGEREWGKCRACHRLDGTDSTGPHLDGIAGRAVGAIDGFSYSDVMASHGGEWTPELLMDFLENPRGEMPGTKMVFAGIRDPQARANLVASLPEP